MIKIVDMHHRKEGSSTTIERRLQPCSWEMEDIT